MESVVKELNDFGRRGGYYIRAPIARQAFSAVPLRQFDLMWADRNYADNMEIEIQSTDNWAIRMEFIADTTEQIFVRPDRSIDPDTLKRAALKSVFIPAMTGLAREEPLYARPETVADLLGQAKSGDVLRNLLYQAHRSEKAWTALQKSMDRLFCYRLLPPDAAGAYIVAEFQTKPDGPRFDVAGAGAGFQQVLLLLTLLNIRPASVLLLDEPDAHLHPTLQNAIYGELRAAARRQKSQLIIATHSEAIINSVELQVLFVIM